MTDEQIIKASENAIAVVDWAIDLINRQKAEIERLLQKLQQAKSEAIKEFAERLKKGGILIKCV